MMKASYLTSYHLELLLANLLPQIEKPSSLQNLQYRYPLLHFCQGYSNKLIGARAVATAGASSLPQDDLELSCNSPLGACADEQEAQLE